MTVKDAWCPHARKGQGCAMYETRPEACRTFHCQWLLGGLPQWARPDKIHGVVTIQASGLQLNEDPGWPRMASQILEPLLHDHYRAGETLTIVCGTDWRVRGTPETLARVQEIRAT